MRDEKRRGSLARPSTSFRETKYKRLGDSTEMNSNISRRNNDEQRLLVANEKEGIAGRKDGAMLTENNQTEDKNDEETVKPKERSILFQPLTFLFLFISLLLALWFKMTILIGLFAFLIVLSLFIYAWREYSLKKVKVELEVNRRRVFSGEPFDMYLQVKNDKWIPLVWLEVEVDGSNFVRWGEKELDGYLLRLLWLLSYDKTTWFATGYSQHRGVYPIGRLRLRSGDGFRFSEKETTYNIAEKLYIYPERVDVRVPPLHSTMPWETKGLRGGFLEDPLLVTGVREYVSGDERKLINWRASARSGRLMTNVLTPIVSKQIIVYVDVTGFTIEQEKFTEEEKQLAYEREKRSSFETFLSIVASFLLAYHEQNVHITYKSNGKNYLGEPPSPVLASMPFTLILDALAELTATASEKGTYAREEVMALVKERVPFFIFTYNLTKKDIDFYEKKQNGLDLQYYYMKENKWVSELGSAGAPIDSLLVRK